MKRFKLVMALTLIVIGIIGLITITSTYDFDNNYESIDTDESMVFNRDSSPDWRQGGVAIDSNVDGAVAGLGISCGLMILSGSVLLSRIDT